MQFKEAETTEQRAQSKMSVCKRATFAQQKSFGLETRAISNEIENYLCDLGPGINLFLPFFGSFDFGLALFFFFFFVFFCYH